MFIQRFCNAAKFAYEFAKNLPVRQFSNLNGCKAKDLSLYLVTHRSCVANDEIFISKVLSAVKGGVSCVQIRDRDEDIDALIRTARKLKCLLTPLNIPLIINDHVDIALEVQADGVHLGQKDLPYHVARKLLGPDAIIGLSVDTWDDVVKAQDLDVDYLGINQLFGSKITKPDCREPWGLGELKKIRAFSKHRLVPIGGINSSNVQSVCNVLHLGCKQDGIAMVGDLWRSEYPNLVAQKIRSIMNNTLIERESTHV